MKNLGTLMVAGLALAAGGCASMAQPQANTQIASTHCASLQDVDRKVADLAGAGQVARVEPVHRQQFFARALQPKYVAGAELYVPAQQGWSAPYLDRVLSCHAASQASTHPNDPLRVANLESIAVKASGSHFVVSILGKDPAAGKEIYQRAQALRDPAGQVDVRQLSARDVPAKM